MPVTDNGFWPAIDRLDMALCERFVDRNYFVVRFDNRDSGLSKHFDDYTKPNLEQGLSGDTSSVGYSLDDMANDALGLLDHLRNSGCSYLGGVDGSMIAQLIAIREPKRVKSLVLLSTTTGDPTVGQPAPEIQAAPFLRNHGDDILKNAVESSGRWASWTLAYRRGIAGAHSGAN